MRLWWKRYRCQTCGVRIKRWEFEGYGERCFGCAKAARKKTKPTALEQIWTLAASGDQNLDPTLTTIQRVAEAELKRIREASR